MDITWSRVPADTADLDLTPKGRRFLRRMTAATGGGMFIDGFVFATFAAALAGRAVDVLHVSSLWESLISSSVLIGTFFGGILLGYVTDRIGRKPMFTIDLSAFLVCSILLFFVTAPWQIFALGLVMGLAVGAEILWNVGYVTAYLIGYAINSYAPGAWRVILAASAVPAVIFLIMRHGLPESPRWLVSKGRRDEAMEIMRTAMDTDRAGDLANEERGEDQLGGAVHARLRAPDDLRRGILERDRPAVLRADVLPAGHPAQPRARRRLAARGPARDHHRADRRDDRVVPGRPGGAAQDPDPADVRLCDVPAARGRVPAPAGRGRGDLLLRLPVLVRGHVDPDRDHSRGGVPQLGSRVRAAGSSPGCGRRKPTAAN